jgi:hypothetical protein
MAGKAKTARAASIATQLEVVDTCGLCHWWDHVAQGIGRCRRYPPVPMPGSAGTWPMTAAEGYCGEFTEKAKPPAAPVGFAPPVEAGPA